VTPDDTSKTTKSDTPTLATNTVGESLHDSAETAPNAEKTISPPSAVVDAHTEHVEELEKDLISNESTNHESEPVKKSDEPPVVSESTVASEPVDEEDLSASTATLKPNTENVE
jgi:hypothetical protein